MHASSLMAQIDVHVSSFNTRVSHVIFAVSKMIHQCHQAAKWTNLKLLGRPSSCQWPTKRNPQCEDSPIGFMNEQTQDQADQAFAVLWSSWCGRVCHLLQGLSMACWLASGPPHSAALLCILFFFFVPRRAGVIRVNAFMSDGHSESPPESTEDESNESNLFRKKDDPSENEIQVLLSARYYTHPSWDLKDIQHPSTFQLPCLSSWKPIIQIRVRLHNIN